MKNSIDLFDISQVIREHDPPTGSDPCIICGKDLEGKQEIYLHLDTEMNAYPKGQEPAVEDDFGLHQLGSNCAKKIPKQYWR